MNLETENHEPKDGHSVNSVLGPSIFLQILDMFLDHPNDLVNIRETSRRINKNPGSVSPVIPKLVKRQLITVIKIGAKITAFQLNKENETVKHLIELHNRMTV